MNIRLKKLNLLQEEAVNALAKANYNGTILLFTGSGKSIIIQKTIYKALDEGILQKGDTIYLMAEEVKSRKRTFFKKEIPFFTSISGKNILEDFDFQFHSYQSSEKLLIKMKKGLISIPTFIAMDEVECSFTPNRINIFYLQNKGTKICGFTATTSAISNVYKDRVNFDVRQSDFATKKKKITSYINKGQCFDIFCPVVFFKDFNYGIEQGILSPFRTTLITHELGTKDKYLTMSKKNNWKGSEKEYYSYFKNLIELGKITEEFKIIINQMKLPQLLYKMRSKVIVGKKLLEKLEGKKILIFGKELSFLRKLTDNVVEDYWIINKKKVYDLKSFKKSNNITRLIPKVGENDVKDFTKVKIESILDKFDSNEITILGSSKRLQRGVTLKGLDTVIIFIFNKHCHTLLQILGRLIRYDEGKIGHLIIVYTKDTFENNWFEESLKIKNYKGEVIDRIDLRITKVISSRDLWLPNLKL